MAADGKRLGAKAGRALMRGLAPVNGAGIYYEKLGDGEPIVLIHGNMVDVMAMTEAEAEGTSRSRAAGRSIAAEYPGAKIRRRVDPDERDDEGCEEGRGVAAFPGRRLRHFQKQGSVEEELRKRRSRVQVQLKLRDRQPSK